MTPPTPDAELERLEAEELRDAWSLLDPTDRNAAFHSLTPEAAESFFLDLTIKEQLELLAGLSASERRLWLRLLAPDDAADLIQETPSEEKSTLLGLLDEPTRKEVVGLLAYAEDDAGGLMSPRFARVRPEMTVDEAVIYLRRQARERLETIYYGYVLDANQKLLGVVSFRDLFSSEGGTPVRDVMKTDLVTVAETMDQEKVGRLFAQHDLVALPVVDEAGRMKGIVTFDDIVDVVQEEATEDIQKMGGSGALGAPYLELSFLGMLRKRAGWLVLLFFGELLTANAMAQYELTIHKATVLALFIPLIISSGGNSGSQASTLVIRAMALGEVRRRDWLRILRREVGVGLALGALLGALGLARVALPGLFEIGGQDYLPVAMVVAISLAGVVLWGTICGSMLPILLKRLGFDPASASAPLVATIVDVTGLIIYFNVAAICLAERLAGS